MEVNGVSLTIAPVYYLNKISSLRTQAEPGSVPKLRRQGSEFREIRVAIINDLFHIPEFIVFYTNSLEHSNEEMILICQTHRKRDD